MTVAAKGWVSKMPDPVYNTAESDGNLRGVPGMVYANSVADQSDMGNHNPRVGGSSPSSATINQALGDGLAGRFTGAVNLSLSERAFLGRVAYQRECVMALDFSSDAPALPKRKRPSLYAYFIGGEYGPIKIGSARDPYARLLTLQTGHPEELYLYAYVDGGSFKERDLHGEFSADRLRGEWFKRTDRILRRIIHFQQQEDALYA
jgi:Meiotically up-regulated gene 113